MRRSFKTLGLVILVAILGFSSVAAAEEPAPRPGKVLSYLTAYTPSVSETDAEPRIAAGNKPVYDGMIANNCLLPGTKVKFYTLEMAPMFNGREFTIDDRMNRRWGCGSMDFFMDLPKAEARKFGKQLVIVEYYYPAGGSQPKK